MNLDQLKAYFEEVDKLLAAFEKLGAAIDVVTEEAFASMPINPDQPIQ